MTFLDVEVHKGAHRATCTPSCCPPSPSYGQTLRSCPPAQDQPHTDFYPHFQRQNLEAKCGDSGRQSESREQAIVGGLVHRGGGRCGVLGGVTDEKPVLFLPHPAQELRHH